MDRRTRTTGLVSVIVLLVLAGLAYSPLHRYWYGYLNDYATRHFINQTLAFNARKDQNVPDGAVLFYGDSLVQGLNVAKASPLAVNYGVGHAGSADVVNQLKRHENIGKASALVMAVGINDIARGHSQVVLPFYAEALKYIPDSLPVIISLIKPVDDTYLGRQGISDAVKQVNQSLNALCSRHANVVCLDSSAALTGQNGQLARQYHTGDGLHLNATGNAIWLEQLRLAIIEAIGLPDKDITNASTR